ncbi:hypothetical protein Goari_016729, partial [Gossypium aridum]|nr:hypothetical protein [Gossypium aridum]
RSAGGRQWRLPVRLDQWRLFDRRGWSRGGYWWSNKRSNWMLDGGFRNGSEMVKTESDNALLIDTLRNGLVAVSNIVEVRMIREWFYKSWEVKC